MDYSRPLLYRGLDHNSVVIDSQTSEQEARVGRIAGIQLEDFIVGSVQGVGYTEKRSNADGRDSSDVFLDSRRFIAQGTVYGFSAADAHDRFQHLCAVNNPVGAFNESPGAYGYLPLAWFEPTLDTRYDADDEGNRWRLVFANVRPLVIPERRWTRDRAGGVASLGLAIPFTAYWEAVDPRIYADPFVQALIDGAAGTDSGSFVHKGDHPSPLNVLLSVAAGAAAGLVTITAGGSVMKITIPDEDQTQVFRYNGALKVLTVEQNSIETQRQDLLSFTTEKTHPLIDPTPEGGPGSAWQVTSTVTLGVGSRLWFHEAYS